MDPPPDSTTDQLTAELDVLVTVAANVLEAPVSKGVEAPKMLTVTIGVGALRGAPPPPPQPTKQAVSTTAKLLFHVIIGSSKGPMSTSSRQYDRQTSEDTYAATPHIRTSTGFPSPTGLQHLRGRKAITRRVFCSREWSRIEQCSALQLVPASGSDQSVGKAEKPDCCPVQLGSR